MPLELSNLKPSPGARKQRKRVGRGVGSGTGKTSGRGHGGQKSRSGYKTRPWSEGGQMPIQRRIPKRGFTNIFRVEYQPVNLDRLAKCKDTEITPEVLKKQGIIKTLNRPVKVLGTGKLELALTVKVAAFSKSAIEKIEAAGGKAEVTKC